MPAAPHPELPELPRAGGSRPSRALSCLAVSLALLLALLVLGVLIFLSLGFAAVVVGVFAGVLGLIGIQYLLWGWWLPGMIEPEPPDEPPSSWHSE